MSDTMINLPSQWQYSLAAGTMTNQYGYCDYTTPLPSMTAFNYASAPVFTPTSGEQLCAIYVYCVRCVASCRCMQSDPNGFRAFRAAADQPIHWSYPRCCIHAEPAVSVASQPRQRARCSHLSSP